MGDPTVRNCSVDLNVAGCNNSFCAVSDRNGRLLFAGGCGGGCGGSCNFGCEAIDDSVLILCCEATVFALERVMVELWPFGICSDRVSGSSERCE
jgi:hypothetical protein